MPDDSPWFPPPPPPPPPPASVLPPSIPEGTRGRRHRWPLAVAGVLAVALVAVGVAVIVARDDGDDGGCVVALAGRLSIDGYVEGADLDRARQAGYADDGDVDALVDAQRETGALPDPVTEQVLNSTFEIDRGVTGFAPADVRCWVGTSDDALLDGAFDADAIDASELGRADTLAAADELVAYGRGSDDARIPAGDRGGDDPTVPPALAVLDDEGAYSFVLTDTDGADGGLRWVGLGIAEGERGREVLVVWSYADADAAEADLEARADGLDDGDLDEVMRVDPDELERRDEVIVLRGRVVGDATRWTTPIQVLDPALVGDIFD